MTSKLAVEFVSLKDAARTGRAKGAAEPRTLVVFAGADLAFGKETASLLGDSVEHIKRAAAAASFKGKASSVLEMWGPAGLKADRLIVVGAAPKQPPAAPAPTDSLSLGGYVMGKLGRKGEAVVVFDMPEAPANAAEAAADLMLGMRMRAYRFERYKTKKGEDAEPEGALTVRIALADPAAAKKLAKSREAVAEGVDIARDLVNEPPNVLYPEEFAKRAKALTKLGVEVEILDVKAMQKLGMNALLGVGQGSVRDSRLVIMRWNGAKDSKAKPVAFIGKGVTFDTGGISIKPAGGMEDMKGDMAGAACVVGLMHALAARKAKVNVVGAIGLVENMPDGNAQRPGDIVKSLSGQTVEIINTDAEGPAGAGGRAVAHPGPVRSAVHGEPRHAHGRDSRGAGLGPRRPVLQQRRAGRAPHRGGQGNRGKSLADAAWPRLRQDARFQVRRHEERRRPARGLDHGGAVPAALRQQEALGASRHRGHRHGLADDRHQPDLGIGLGRAASRQARRGPLRDMKVRS